VMACFFLAARFTGFIRPPLLCRRYSLHFSRAVAFEEIVLTSSLFSSSSVSPFWDILVA
jgi:hypothetical protein